MQSRVVALQALEETLKAILALGYRIELPPKSPPSFPHEEVDRIVQRLLELTPLDLTALQALWQERAPERWAAETEAAGENCLRALSRFTPEEKRCDVQGKPGIGRDHRSGFKREK